MHIYKSLFDEFLTSDNTLQVYEDDKLVFASNKDRLLPLAEYIEKSASDHQDVVIFDKIMGRAAALLCVKASCQEVYSPLGSQLAIETLDKYGIKHHLTQIVVEVKSEARTKREALPMGPVH